MEINSDSEALLEVIEHFADEGYLERDKGAYWSSVKYAEEGCDSLSPAQKYCVDRVFIPLLKKHSCPACGDLVPPGLKYCEQHQQQWDKD